MEFKYINETNSWINFNYRILNESKRENIPILERLKFVGIADSNLDEFIRTKFDNNNKECYELIKKLTFDIDNQYDYLLNELKTKYNVNIVKINELDDKNLEKIFSKFNKNIYPLIQPLKLMDTLPLPEMTDDASFLVTKFDDGTSGIIRMPEEKLIEMKNDETGEKYYLYSSDMIKEFISEFYKGKKIVDICEFRLFRQINNLSGVSNIPYVESIKNQLKNRKKADILLVDCNGSTKIIKPYIDALKRKRKYIYGLSFLKSMKDFIDYTDDMVYEKYKGRSSSLSKNAFKTLSKHSVLVQFPYDAFEKSTLAFIKQAAEDDAVISIKQTLYRVSKDSDIIKSLCNAAALGKQVVVLLELKAKMDEIHNYELVKTLTDSGCLVIFGPTEIKTHCKITLVIRREKNNKIEKYYNISTGNFNDDTAKIYEDISYFAKDNGDGIGNELCELFNTLGGYSQLSNINDLLIAPVNFRSGIENYINTAINLKTQYPDKDIEIVIKVNALTDVAMCNKLYEASNAGVKIQLIVRGMCILIPGVPGMSENITVKSVIGRFLEHSRIYKFNLYNAVKDKMVTKIFIGSGDLMERNLTHRVEVLTPIKSKMAKIKINNILNGYLNDTQNSYVLNSDGTYINPPDDNADGIQKLLMNEEV